MMTCGLKRSILLLLCVASVLLSGCVSRGKYDDLQGQYTTLQGQYTTLQRQYGDADDPISGEATGQGKVALTLKALTNITNVDCGR